MARLLLTLVSCIAVLGCSQLPGRPKPGPEVPRPDSIVDFATLYSQNCSACHGAQGMNGPSYPLANPTYQAMVDEQVLHQTVANGLPGTLMPAFAISAGTPDGAPPPPYKASMTVNAAHGQQVYTSSCASCHGGINTASQGKAGSILDPAFLSLVSDQTLRTIVIAGRPDIGQPDWRNVQPGHPLSDQDVTDVVGWLSSQRAAQQAKSAGGGQ
jgi:cytochrome c oxidase cbb3-type subunit 3